MATAGCSVAAESEAGSDDARTRLQLTEGLESRLRVRVRDSIPELLEALKGAIEDRVFPPLTDQPEAYLDRALTERCLESVASAQEEIGTSQLQTSQKDRLLQMDGDAFVHRAGQSVLISHQSCQE